MKLFHIDAGKEWRGGQRQVLYLTDELVKRGYPVRLITQPDSPLHHEARKRNIPVIKVRIRNEFDLLAVMRIAYFLKKERAILVHFHDAHSLAVGSIAANIMKTPLKVLSRRVDFPLRKNFLSKIKYSKGIDGIIAISNGIKKVLMEEKIIDEKSIEVIHPGTDFSLFKLKFDKNYLRKELGFSKDDYLVGIIAHLADHKGHKYLIEASQFINKVTNKIKIIIVGEGPLKMELRKKAKKLNTTNIVFFLGFRKDIPQILHSLDLFVLSSYLEGLGSSILDAMACKLPVVATSTGGIPEAVKNGVTGILVPPRNPKALAEAILKLYKDKDLAKKMGEEGFKLVHEKFSVKSMVDRTIDFYNKLAMEKGIKLKFEN
ncbi:glycosyltransferase family 4 protein [Candidatus Aminicenantes bacterium AC-335-A11]|nr:glycosyltransferase family 4 protein [Candidatus Aminicenantes bacterium AC-335-A11]